MWLANICWDDKEKNPSVIMRVQRQCPPIKEVLRIVLCFQYITIMRKEGSICIHAYDMYTYKYIDIDIPQRVSLDIINNNNNNNNNMYLYSASI